MTVSRVVDLHPEDLLERDALGDLEDSERARLDAHLARCSTCRFERQLRADFAEELEDDGAPLAPTGLMAEVLLATAPTAPTAPEAPQPASVVAAGGSAVTPIASVPRRAWGRGRAKRAVWLLAAASLLLLAGGAAAAMGLGVRGWPSLVGATPPEAVLPSGVASSPAHSKLRSAAPLPAPPELEAPVTVEAAIEVAPPVATQVAPQPVATPAVVAHAAPSGAAQLFDAETEARRRGDYVRVVDLHRELQQRFGRSREAQVSRATVAHLLLDRGNPAGALANFDAYLAAGSGTLGEEAMVGRATALERLGRRDEASLAWKALVSAYPDTPYAAHARARVESIAGD